MTARTRMVVAIDARGVMRFVDHGSFRGLAGFEGAVLRRASHVEPANGFKRVLFRVVRCVAGDQGPVARWSRRWRGNWRVDLGPSGGPVLGPFADRKQAIDREIQWLSEHALGDPSHFTPATSHPAPRQSCRI